MYNRRRRTLSASLLPVSAVSLLPIWAALLLMGCGTSSVSMVVVRPAVINAQPFGGTVSVAGFAAPRPDYAIIAGQLREEVQRELLGGVGGVVRVVDYGAGLTVSGRVDEYRMRLREESREESCKKKVVHVNTTTGEESPVTYVKGKCKLRRLRWNAHVAVLVRVQASSGQLVYLRHVVERETGRTPEVRDVAPRPPRTHALLRKMRLRVAQRIAHLVVPHRARVTATMYDCKGAAEGLCNTGVKRMAQSRYDDALAAYTQALAVLKSTPQTRKTALGEVHWNRAQVNKYARRYDAAIAELQLALGFDPGNRTYTREFQVVQAARQSHKQLIDQGLVGR